MKRLLVLALWMLSVSLAAQVMPSPDAASLIKNINTPVNLYNGVASVSIPLYEATANNGASVPVGLTYTAGGIKVNEISGVAGLGWQLSAGGSITRIVRDQPDEHAIFTTDLNYQTLRNIANGQQKFDLQKDVFFFTFPGGGGKFIFSTDNLFFNAGGSFRRDCIGSCGSLDAACLAACVETYGTSENGFITPDAYSTSGIVTLPSSDIRISFHFEDKLDSYFVITDTQGTKYYFGQTAEAREKTTNNFKDNFNNEEYQYKNEREFISTWHLSKIEYPNLPPDDGITFSYENNTITNEMVNRMVPARSDLNLYAECMEAKSQGENCDDCMDFNGEVDNPHEEGSSAYIEINKHNKYYRNNFVTQKSTIETKLISRIAFTKGYIEFEYTPERNDLENGKRLAAVSIGQGSTIVSKTVLDHSFFTSSDSYYKGGTLNVVTHKGSRLKLDAVIRDGIPVAEFNYINDQFFHPNGADMYELPPRDSYYTDHWGYYNGGPHQGETYTWHGQAVVDGTTFAGMDKSISEYAKANILTKVIYPTGGYKEFIYGIHAEHGGVRVDTVKIFDGNDQIVSDMSYNYLDEYNPLDFEYVADHIVTVPQDRNEVTGKQIPHIFESSHTFVFDLNGPSNGYRTVEEYNNTNGTKSVHEFIRTGDTDRDIQYASKSYAIVDTYQDTFDPFDDRPVYDADRLTISHYEPLDDYAFPYTTPSLVYFDRGVEKKVTNYDRTGKKISEVENHFVHDTVSDFSVANHSFHLEYLDEDVGALQDNSLEFWYVVSRYDISTRNLKLDHSIAKSYDDLGLLITETRTDYTYSSEYETLPILVKSETTDGTEVIQGTETRTYYPFEKDDITIVETPTVLDIMHGINMIAVPVQSESKVLLPGETQYKYSSNSLTTFKESNLMYFPYESYAVSMNELKDESYVFQPNDFEPISTVEYDDQGWMTSQKGQDGVLTTYAYDSRGYVTSKTIDPGVASLKRTSYYEYFPLGRLKKVTDPNGKSISYVYDAQNRLLMTKNSYGAILKRYRYNTVRESESGLSVDITGYDGYNLTGSPITLKATLTGSTYGSPQYSWTNDVSSTRFAEYTFTDAGSYNVTVTVTDLEHPDLSTSDSYPIEVFDNIASLTIDGPSSVEYCPDTGDDPVIEGPGGGESDPPGETGAFYSGSSLFSYGFSYGARCWEGYEFVKFEYKKSGIDWTRFGEAGVKTATLPLSAFNPSATSSYNIDVRVTVKDLCGNSEMTEMTSITVNRCRGGVGDGLGGDGDGSGDTGWTLTLSPNTAELCPDGSPSSVSFTATAGDLPTCSTGFTYSWEYKGVGESSWTALSSTSSTATVTRNTLTNGGAVTNGSWDVKVTVSDGCGGTIVKTSRVNILSNCSGDGVN